MRALTDGEAKVLDRAGALAKAQLKLAVEITEEVLKNDQRGLDPAVLSAVVQALATNYAHYARPV